MLKFSKKFKNMSIFVILLAFTIFTGYKTFNFLIKKQNFSSTLKFKPENSNLPKKKILILYSGGGAGHKSATETIKKMLEDKYIVETANFFETIVKSLDLLNACTFGYITGEQLYNKIFQMGFIGLTNRIALDFGPTLMQWQYNKILKLSKKYFEEHNIDFIISTIPLINGAASSAAQELNIPYLLVTLDPEVETWLNCLYDKNIPNNFYMTIWNRNPKIDSQIIEHKIPESRIYKLGFPLREQFFEEKNKIELRKKYDIPPDKFVVMIMLGGAGGSTIFRYTKKILQSGISAHIIACAGRDERTLSKLNLLRKKNKSEVCSLSALGFTPNISDIMALSDVLITKAGPATMNESVHMKLPLIIDASSGILKWEKAGIDLMEENNFGKSFKDLDGLINVVKEYSKLTDQDKNKIYQNSAEIIPVITQEKIQNLVQEIFDKQKNN